MNFTRREWMATLAAAPLLRAADPPASPVAIAKCYGGYGADVTAKINTLFDQLGGLSGLVRNKTVAIKINMTGSPRQRLQRLPPALTHYTHPAVLGAVVAAIGRAGARRIRILESGPGTTEPLQETMIQAGWDPKALETAAQLVEFENTIGIGRGKKYSRFTVPGQAYMYPAYDLNHSYEETDVFVSLAKLKNHATCGITLSIKNCFGCLPASIYGDDAGVDAPNERPHGGRESVGHQGRRQPSKSAPQELHFGATHDAGYRVPHIVADLSAARPIHLAILDGVESIAGGEGPWNGSGVHVVKPGLLIAGLNPVCTDAVCAAVMGYDPRAQRGSGPFKTCDNTILLAEGHGVGSADLKRIDVRGVPIQQALYRYDR
jgi:uncharacterized protein (DUF362 family)